LVADKLLVPARIFAPTTFRVDAVKTVAGDFHIGELSRAVDQPKLVGDIVGNWQKFGENRQTIAFCVDLNHARHVVQQFNAAGIAAVLIDGEMPADQREKFRFEFEAGRIRIVVNVGTLVAGFDAPHVGCIILARPTQSEVLFVQSVGRGLRPARGKVDCLVLDHAGNALRLGLPEDIDYPVLDRGAGWREAPTDPGVRRCATCARVKRHTDTCGQCPAPALPATAPGQLRQVVPTAATRHRAEQHAFLSGLRWIAIERGYAPGWPNVQFKARFGFWPDGLDARPAPPDDATQAWFASWRADARQRLRSRTHA
jgi:DNA repair protein RadD